MRGGKRQTKTERPTNRFPKLRQTLVPNVIPAPVVKGLN